MSSLLEVIITFVAAMLILALIAQSVQELIKVTFAVKGATARHALEKLVGEAARARGLLRGDGQQLTQAIVTRLGNLGQHGVRPRSLRLDTLSAPLLGELIRSIEPAEVASLKGLSREQADLRLDELAATAVRWFPLAMDPVSDRYRRRMRGLALLSAAVVVIGLNADAMTILQKARHDPGFRERIQRTALELDSLDQRALTAASDTAAGPAARAAADSARKLQAALLSADDPLFGGGDRRPTEPLWWAGILASTLLVSLGAPFWHDALESLFGFKNRLRAEAERVKAAALPMVATVRTTEEPGAVTETKVTAKPVNELK
jgi:hypothetical protein